MHFKVESGSCVEAGCRVNGCDSPAGRSLFFPNMTMPSGAVGGYTTKVSHPFGFGCKNMRYDYRFLRSYVL